MAVVLERIQKSTSYHTGTECSTKGHHHRQPSEIFPPRRILPLYTAPPAHWQKDLTRPPTLAISEEPPYKPYVIGKNTITGEISLALPARLDCCD